jgi:hypothetical protein
MRRLARLLLLTLGPSALLTAVGACGREAPGEHAGRGIARGIGRMTR